MKRFKNIFKILAITLLIVSCTDETRNTSFAAYILPPSDVSAKYDITQDNSGVVTITPSAEGATKFDVYYGDGTAAPVEVAIGGNTTHTYAEGSYTVKVVAYNSNGITTSADVPLMVSFIAPTNEVIEISNDQAVSKQVNITVTADFATLYEFYSGEPGMTDPAATANIGETINYQYASAGDYDIRIVIKGGAIETTEYTDTFTVTEILQPVASAPTPPYRNDTDVITIYSNTYTPVAGVNTFPDWGQAGQGSGWAEFDLNGDKMLQYINLSYQGIQFAAAEDVSGMEYIHLDVWTSGDVNRIETSLISQSNGERPVWSDLTADSWTSINIPISAFTDQNGFTVADIHQLKFVGDPWAAGTVFIDNIYFWKEPSGVVYNAVEDFEGTAPTFISFGGAGVEVVANPNPSSENNTSKSARLTKGAGAEVWAGGFFEVGSPLDLANFGKISLKTYSPKVGAVVKVKLENSDASITHEIDVNTTVANAWEELIFNFSSAPTADYIRIVVFFDFGNSGDGSEYYYDEINLVDDSGGPQPLIFQDFEGTAPAFTSFGGAGVVVEANANPDAVNGTANAAKLTKGAGAEIWAGSFFETASPLDFNTYSKIRVKTWSPKVGAVVKVKLENSDASITHEIDVNTTTANNWEDLVFDFSGAPTADYIRVVIFFDFGNSGDDSVYYFDEYALVN